MSVAVSQAPDWEQWEGEIVAGEFPLHNLIGTGEKSAVFRTTGAAIKLVSASASRAQELVEQWTRTRALKHPHLLQIHSSGTWSRDGATFAYLVMEYAEENLGAVLAERSLTAEETREMLPPVASVLAFLHKQGLAHGRLKPANVFAVDDTLKLSSDRISTGGSSDDMRAVVTLTENVLGKPELPQDFREIRNCAVQNGGQWSAEELSRWLASPRATGLVKPAQVAVAKPQSPRVTRVALGVAAGLVLLLAVGGILKSRSADSEPSTAAKSPAPTAEAASAASSAPPPAPVKEKPARSVKTSAPVDVKVEAKAEPPRAEPASPRPAQPAQVPATQVSATGGATGQIAIQVLPEITDKARTTVHGTVVLRVRVKVAPSGDVTEATLLPTGSHYLGKLAAEAARKWRFAPANETRDGTVRFEITRTESKATADIR